MQSIVLTDPTGARAEILPEKGATVISYRSRGQEVFYRDQENLDSPERPRCGVPFLFPVFGRTPEGSHYPMEIHGFGHTSSWQVLSREESCLKLELRDSEQTRAVYPFPFRVELTFALENGRLHIRQRYENPGQEKMPFAFGFHPYFVVEDPEKTRVDIHAAVEMDMGTGKAMPCTRESVSVSFPESAPETGAFFAQASDCAVIRTERGAVKMAFDGNFNRLVLWAVRGKGFLCVEPINSSPNGLVTGDCFTLEPGGSREAEISFEVLK